MHDHTSASSRRRRGAPPGARSGRRRSGRRLGQHFLYDDSVCARIARAARLAPGEAVLEVGPGRGALTRHLVKNADPLVLVELDPDLAAALRDRYAGSPAVSVIEADARDIEAAEIPEIAGRPYKVVANLPYYAASPIIRRFLESERPPSEMVVMVQQEVGQEMAAPEGRMGLLTVATRFYAEPEALFDVPPDAFRPPPKVTSSVVRLTARSEPLLELDDTGRFFDLVRAGFRAPRKQLGNSLARGLGIEPPAARVLLAAAGIETTRRPATLSMAEWGELYGVWAAGPGRREPEPD